MAVQGLSYVGIGVADVDAWMRFATEALGLMPGGQDSVRRLRIDERAWRIAVHQSPADDLLYAGFDLADDAALGEFRSLLDARGIGYADLTPEECAERQVAGGLHIHDPDEVRLEFVHGARQADTPFHSDITEGFVTGSQGLGHVVLSVSDLERSTDFYEQLGFMISDYITVSMGPDATLRVAFMHCNARHHSVAMAVLPGEKRLNHIMLEVAEVDDVIRGHRRCVEQGYATGQIGRHPNDRMLSFYVTAPGGFEVEFGWGGCLIGDDWAVHEYDVISLWGHERTV